MRNNKQNICLNQLTLTTFGNAGGGQTSGNVWLILEIPSEGDNMVEFQVIWILQDGSQSPSAGVHPTRDAAESVIRHLIRENIAPSTNYFIIPVIYPFIKRRCDVKR